MAKIKRKRQKAKQAAFSSAPVPYPEKRAPGQRPPTHSVAHVSENNAKHYLQMAFQHYLHGHIKSALKTYINKRQDLSDKVTTSILDAVLATNRSPRGIFVKADELAGYPINTILTSVGRKHTVSADWKDYVKSNFTAVLGGLREWYEEQLRRAREEEILRQELKALGKRKQRQDVNENNMVEQQQELTLESTRTCSTTLEKILRQLPNGADETEFVGRLKSTSLATTDYVADLSTVVRASLITIASYGFDVDENGIVTRRTRQDWPQISDFVPKSAQRNKEYILPSGRIPVSPLPTENIDKVKKSHDVISMFQSNTHVDYIHSRCFYAPCPTDNSEPGQTEDDQDDDTIEARNLRKGKPAWNELLLFHDSPQPLPNGLSQTLKAARAMYSTNLSNIWKGTIFGRCLDRLILIYLRLHLAPRREKRYMDLVHRKSNEKKQEKEQKAETVDRAATRQILRRESKYSKICADKTKETGESKWIQRETLCNERRAAMYEKHRLTRGDRPLKSTINLHSDTASEQQLTSGTDEEEDLVDVLVGAGHEEEAIAELLEDLQGQDNDDEAQAQAHEPVAKTDDQDVSSKRITSLKVIAKKLILTNTATDDTFLQKLVNIWHGQTPLEEREISTVNALCKLLQPFVPKENMPSSVLFKLPIVLISNTVQQVAGYGSYAREFCPYISPASIQSLPLTAATIFEIMCSSSRSEGYTIKDQNGGPITSYAWATHNKEATFGSFLDLDRIKQICSDHHLRFDHRIMLLPNGIVRIQGTLLETVKPAMSYYNERKKRNIGTAVSKSKKRTPSSQSPPSAEHTRKLEALNENIRTLEAEVRATGTSFRNSDNAVKAKKTERKYLKGDLASPVTPVHDEKIQASKTAHEQLRSLKATRNDCFLASSSAKNRLKAVRKEKYCFIKAAEAKVTSGSKVGTSLACPPPTLERPECEEATEKLDVSKLISESEDVDREVVFGGTDYGLVTMATTVRLPIDRYHRKVDLYNHFSVLADESECMQIDFECQDSDSEPSKCFRVTAEQINQRALARKHGKSLQRRKKGVPEVQAAEKCLAENSVAKAIAAEQVFHQHGVCKSNRDDLRRFYHSEKLHKEQRTADLLNKKVYDQMASEERQFISCSADCNHQHRPKTPIMLIGTAGTSVGSRIGGHARRGGGKMRRNHCRYVTVGMTNEYNTSQTCSTCFLPIVHPRIRKFVKGTWKTVTNNGTSVCLNQDCPTYQAGTNSRNRDVQAAECIAMAGASLLLTGRTLPPFDDQHSQFNTVHFPTASSTDKRCEAGPSQHWNTF